MAIGLRWGGTIVWVGCSVSKKRVFLINVIAADETFIANRSSRMSQFIAIH